MKPLKVHTPLRSDKDVENGACRVSGGNVHTPLRSDKDAIEFKKPLYLFLSSHSTQVR